MKMTYALLIAINDYHPIKVGALKGCISDSLAVEELLKKLIPEEQLMIKKLHDHDATKAGIAAGFLEFLGQATEEDVIFIHYSGHGSQEKVHPVFSAQESDQLHETLVCYDPHEMLDQGAKISQLADKEIAWLLHRLYQQTGAHIVFVQDSCHSGDATRNVSLEDESTVRSTTGDLINHRQLEDYLFYQHDPKIKKAIKAGLPWQIETGRHIALAACRSYELAREKDFWEGRFGVFTYYFLKVVQNYKGHLNYRDLAQQIGIRTSNAVSYQVPQVFSALEQDLKMNFLAGNTVSDTQYFLTSFSKRIDAWVLQAGAFNGIPREGGQVLLFRDEEAFVQKTVNRDLLVNITKVDPNQSKLEVDEFLQLDKQQSYKSLLYQTSMPKTKIYFDLEIEAPDHSSTLNQHRNELTQVFQENLAAKQSIEIVETVKACHFRVITYDLDGAIKYRITRSDDLKAIAVPVFQKHPEAANVIVNMMLQIANWHTILHLKNPQTNLSPEDFELQVTDQEGNPIDLHSFELNLKYTIDPQTGKSIPPKVRFKLINHSSKKLFACLLFLDYDYSISSGFFPGEWFGVRETINPQGQVIKTVEVKEAYVGANPAHPKGRNIKFEVPEYFRKAGINEAVNYFKLLVSTKEISSFNFHQDALVVDPQIHRSHNTPKTDQELLFGKGNTRSFDDEGWIDLPDWFTAEIRVRTRRG